MEEFNNLDPNQAGEELLKCCGSSFWMKQVMKRFPFSGKDHLKKVSDEAWSNCSHADIMEAFSHHPKIGQKKIDNTFQSTRQWAENEQAGTRDAREEILYQLQSANQAYEDKFGFIFIVCATGKSAKEMLENLTERLNNDAEKELLIAAQEQNKITHLRIDKLIS